MMKKVFIALGGVILLLLVLGWVFRAKMATFFSVESRARANVNIAIDHLNDGKPEAALRSLGGALRLKPDYAEAHYYVAKAYMQQGQPLEAEIEEYKKAIELDPTFLQARHDLGAAYFEKEDYDAAFREVKKVLEIDPANAVGHNNMGRIYMAKMDRRKAEEHLRKALEIDPAYEFALNNLGNLYFLEGKWEKSKTELMKSLAIDPKNPGTHYFLAQVAEKQKDKANAAEHWEKAIEFGLQGDELREAQGRLEALKK